jgi:hypothetical protein
MAVMWLPCPCMQVDTSLEVTTFTALLPTMGCPSVLFLMFCRGTMLAATLCA